MVWSQMTADRKFLKVGHWNDGGKKEQTYLIFMIMRFGANLTNAAETMKPSAPFEENPFYYLTQVN